MGNEFKQYCKNLVERTILNENNNMRFINKIQSEEIKQTAEMFLRMLNENRPDKQVPHAAFHCKCSMCVYTNQLRSQIEEGLKELK